MSRVFISTCPDCGRALKAKAHAPRKRMHITCHCGWRGDVEVNNSLVAQASELRAQGAGQRRQKSPWERLVKSLAIWWQRATLKRHH